MSETVDNTARLELYSPDNTIALKQLVEDDAQGYFDLLNYDRTHLSQHGDTTAEKYPTVESVRDGIMSPPNPSKLRFGVWDGDTMVGSVGLTPLGNGRAETHSWIGKQFIGKEYASRARKLLLDYAFGALGTQVVVSKITIGNNPSRRSVEKSGYTFIGEDSEGHWLYEIREDAFINGD